MIKFDWVLFDADHTLFDFDKASEESLSEVLSAHGFQWAEGMYADYKRINVQCWTEHEEGRIDRDTLVYERFKRYFDFLRLELDPISTQHDYLKRLSQKPFLEPGADQILQWLSVKTKLGYITNGMKEVQRPRLSLTGWTPLFDVIIIGGEVGLSKPHATYFQHVHSLMHQPPRDKVLVVGDSLNADILGASSFGYKTCWYNPSSVPCHPDIVPDYTIQHLEEITRIVV